MEGTGEGGVEVKIHRCYAKIDKKLAESNTRLVRNLLRPNELVVATEKADKSNRMRALTVFASYCPFCGEKVAE